jgi:hypothetical protein
MSEFAETELTEIARTAASKVAGLGTVERVKVTTRLDSTDKPVYYFSFLIDRDRDPEAGVWPRIRLGQKLRDELIARDDYQYPYISVHDRAGWEKVEGA